MLGSGLAESQANRRKPVSLRQTAQNDDVRCRRIGADQIELRCCVGSDCHLNRFKWHKQVRVDRFGVVRSYENQ